MQDKTLGVYVPSYKRSHDIKTYHVLNDCTYVVRESEADAYRRSEEHTSELQSQR